MQGNFLDEEHLHTGCFFHAKSGRETIQRSNVNESAMFEEEKKRQHFSDRQDTDSRITGMGRLGFTSPFGKQSCG